MLDPLYALARPLLFRMDAESAHHLVFHGLPLVPWLAGSRRPDPKLRVTIAGLTWGGPVGLAAGLDKNGVGLAAWEALGFGAIEVGTVTAHAQPGNPRPRLFRLIEEGGLINRMGFNNLGAAALAETLGRVRDAGRWPKVPVGANLGKSKITPNEEAVGDYLESVAVLKGKADYFVVNVSSPNTQGLRALQDKEPLERLLSAVVPAASGTSVFLKLAPDLEDDALSEAVEVAIQAGCAGIIATNTTTSRPEKTARLDQSGGLSGAPLRPLARQKIGVVLAAAAGKCPVIGVGGISTAEDVREYLTMGCAAVQLYSAFVFRGPGLVSRLHRELARQ